MFRRTFLTSTGMALTATLCAPTIASAAVKKPGIVCLTFDDGLLSPMLYAFPTMRKLGLVGTLFVIADPDTPTVRESPPATDPHLLRIGRLTWGEVGEFEKAGWEIGAHTVHHDTLTDLSDRELARELEDCIHIIARNTGIAPQAFASPGGMYGADRELPAIQKLFRSHFGVWGVGLLTKVDLLSNPNRIDPYEVARLGMTGKSPSPRDLLTFVDRTVNTGYMLTLVYHNILLPEQILPDDTLSVGADKFMEFALYLSRLQNGGAIRVMTVTKAFESIAHDYQSSPVARAFAQPLPTKKPT